MTTEIILGINNGFAAKYWPEPDEWARVVAKDLEVKNVQFSFDLLDPTIGKRTISKTCEQIKTAADKNNLILHSTFTGLIIYAQNHLAHPNKKFRDHAYQWYQAALSVTRSLGAEACGGHMGAMSILDYEDRRRRKKIRSYIVDYVRKLTDIAKVLHLQYLLWEPMPSPREIPHTPEESIELLEEVNEGSPVPVYLCFDLGHCNSADFIKPGDPYVWLEKLLPWTRMIHLQQTDGKADRHWPFIAEFNRAGIIVPDRVIEIANASPFPNLPLFFEIGHPFDAPGNVIIDNYKRSIEYWS